MARSLPLAAQSSTEGDGQNMAFVRFNENRTLDTAFGGEGRVTIPFDQGDQNADVAFSVHVRDDGRFIVAGLAIGATPFRCLLAQVLPDGQMDPVFGVVGKVLIDNPFSGDQMGCTRARWHEGCLFLGGIANITAAGSEFDLVTGDVLIEVLFSDDYETD